jgi:putative drug exporter of the RND superfamily
MIVVDRMLGLPAGRRGKWVVLGAWLLLFGVFGWLAGFIQRVEDNNQTNWMPSGAQSTRAVRLADRQFPAAATSPLIIVYGRDGGLTAADRATVERDRARLARLADGPVAGPDFSADGAAALLTLPVATARLDSGQVNQVVAEARRSVRADPPAGLVVKATGPAAARADGAAANAQIDRTLTLAAVAVVALLLLLTYRSPLLLFLPLLCVVAGVVVAQGGTYLAGRAGAVVTGSSFVLMIVLVFGLGTDYALLLISRYREELRRHVDRHRAMAVALRRCAPSVAASAVTMILASLALLAAEMNSTRGLGPVAAVAVAAALSVMTTLLPALLVIAGRGAFWPRVPRPATGARTPGRPGRLWPWIARLVSARPRRTWVAVGLVLAAAGAGAATLHVGGLTGADNYTTRPESVVGQQLLAVHYPAGSGAPALIYTPAGTATSVAAAAAAVPGVASVPPPAVAATGAWAEVTAVLADPPESDAAVRTIQRLRSRLGRIDPRVLVGGQTATLLDRNAAADRDLARLVPVIIAVVVVMLGLLLRAVVAPLLLLGCALLSAGAALGVSTLVFHALGFGRTDQVVLTLGFLFLVALGVDYTIFLMARAREEARRHGHRPGVLRALAATGGVITSAGVVLAATFLILTITPVVLNIQLGLLVALGVMIDAFVVRAALVPALVLDAGPGTWWPGRLPARPAPPVKAPVGEAPVGEASAGEASAGEASAGEASAGEASAGEASAGEAPVGEVPGGYPRGTGNPDW